MHRACMGLNIMASNSVFLLDYANKWVFVTISLSCAIFWAPFFLLFVLSYPECSSVCFVLFWWLVFVLSSNFILFYLLFLTNQFCFLMTNRKVVVQDERDGGEEL